MEIDDIGVVEVACSSDADELVCTQLGNKEQESTRRNCVYNIIASQILEYQNSKESRGRARLPQLIGVCE